MGRKSWLEDAPHPTPHPRIHVKPITFFVSATGNQTGEEERARKGRWAARRRLRLQLASLTSQHHQQSIRTRQTRSSCRTKASPPPLPPPPPPLAQSLMARILPSFTARPKPPVLPPSADPIKQGFTRADVPPTPIPHPPKKQEAPGVGEKRVSGPCYPPDATLLAAKREGSKPGPVKN